MHIHMYHYYIIIIIMIMIIVIITTSAPSGGRGGDRHLRRGRWPAPSDGRLDWSERGKWGQH